MQRRNIEFTEDAIRQKIELSPIEKYIKFGKFPWKTVIFAGLLVFTTIQAINMVEIAASYQKPMLQVFKYILMNSTDQDFSKPIYTLSDYQDHLQSLTSTLTDLDDYMLNEVITNETLYSLQVYYAKPIVSGTNNNSLSGAYTYEIPDISEGIKDPFDMDNISSIKTFVQSIETMNFQIQNLYTVAQLVESQILCYNWTITLQYQFLAMSHIWITLQASPTYCQGNFNQPNVTDDIQVEKFINKYNPPKGGKTNLNTYTYTPFGQNLYLLHLIVLGLAIASLVFQWMYIYEMGLLYMSTRHATHMNQIKVVDDSAEIKEGPYQASWEDLSLMEKIKFFDVFLLITMIGNIFQILGSIISIYENLMPADTSSIVDIKETCIGLGCMCVWFSLIKFLNYNKDFRTTTSILSNSASNFFKFVIGVMPLYMGFVYLGRCLFWKYYKFESTDQAIVALFSIMAGDIIDESYTDTAAEGVLSILYLTIWIILFMAAVHNVFISIISEGFRNKFLEDRYQELFNLYALGDKDVVSNWRINEKDMLAGETHQEDILSLMPYIRRDTDIDFNPENREKIRQIEIEKKRIKETIIYKSNEVEKILQNMKDIVNEYCTVNKDKTEKKRVKDAFLKCLRNMHTFIKEEMIKPN